MKSSFALVFALIASAAIAETKVEDLMKPPADALHYSIVSSAGKHGDSTRWFTADGQEMGRESMVLRGQVFETDSVAKFGADGMLSSVAVRGFTPNGDAAETFTIEGGKAHWKSPVDEGGSDYAAPAMYASFGGTFDLNAILLERVLARPDHQFATLPGGKLSAEKLTEATIGKGARRKTVTAYALTGFSNTPLPIWVDDKGKFFAFAGNLSWIAAGYEDAAETLQKAQDEALAKRSPKLAKALAKAPKGAVAFTHVRAFLDGSHFAENQTVIVEKGKITLVGAAADIKVPAGAQVFDGAGKTLVPGLWDSHMHFGDDASGPMLLSLGITSARDPGNINELTLARAKRRAAGQLLMPHIYPSVLIDGKGPNSAQSGTVVTSEAEAIAAVKKAHEQGFKAIKLYGTFNPAWVKATAAEAHSLGMHVHGHLPAGMRTKEAIADGYDEITHIYFVMMQAMPDEVVNVSNGMARFQGPGKYAKDVDLTAEPMKSLIATMAEKKIASDPTLVVAESLYVPENGDLSPAYAPFVGTLPPAVERGFRQGGFVPQEGVTRADYRASFAKLGDLVGAMHKAGVPVVAGTDGSGMELVRELELYTQFGFTNAEALAAGTIATAKLVGADGHTGSITMGKDADLVLVEGDPSKTIGDLRHTKVVMMDGKLMDADALRSAGGFSGKPKYFE
jgi:imidazolonepropionase-like amidohydrolase